MTQIRRYLGSWPYSEVTCERVDLSYDTNPYEPGYTQNGWGRLAAAQWGGGSCAGGPWTEMYSYTAGGRAVKKKLKRGSGYTLEGQWTYDKEGRMVSVTYPATSQGPGPVFTYTFDAMGRPIKLTDNNATPRDWVKDVSYNAAGQITAIKYWDGIAY